MSGATPIEIGLSAVVVAVEDDTPLTLISPAAADGADDALPYGRFDPVHHRTFETGLRSWVEEQTALKLGYVEQLYTFGDRGRHAEAGDDGRVVSVGHLALTRRNPDSERLIARSGAGWRPWYEHFPWEDWRSGEPESLSQTILPQLARWARSAPTAAPPGRALGRLDRFHLAFGAGGAAWDEERVLDRYELLYEAGLVREAQRDGRVAAEVALPPLGRPMEHDHRRILATAMMRLRAKLKYRPLIFELMAPEFTLTALQRTVEAVAGRHLHKQNFRRLVETTRIVEPTGGTDTGTGGRPAALFRYRPEVLHERPVAGVRIGGRS